MAITQQRRPDGKAPEPRTAVAERDRAALEAELKKVEDQKRALEQRGETGMEPETAARLQPAMGNAAIAGLLNRGTDTATSANEAALEEQQEEEKEEEGEDKEAGEIEHVLPSFTTGGGGGGGASHPPWTMGRMFGGDDDADAPIIEDGAPRWRPMPVLPDPDEDVELEDVEADAPADPDAVDLREATAALGEAPWRPRLLTRGLRHARVLARKAFGPEDLVDADGLDSALGRARTMLRFVAVHGEGLDAMLLARAAAGAGEAVFPTVAGYAGAVARSLALVEVALSLLPGEWSRVLDVVSDGRARARVENAAAVVAEAGALSATALFAEVAGARIQPAPTDLVLACHPAALAALTRAARLEPLPLVDLWEPPARPADGSDAAVDALDAILARFTGAPVPEGPGLVVADVEALFESMNLLLGAIGATLVETASAGVAMAPHLPLPEIAGVLAESEALLRRAARRLVTAGEALEAAIGTTDTDRVRGLAAETLAVRQTTELARQGAMATFGSRLLPREPAAAELPALLALADLEIQAGRTTAARARLDEALAAAPPELEGRVALGVGGALLRMGMDEGGRLLDAAEALGDGLLAAGAHSLAAGYALARGRWDIAERCGAASLRLGVNARLPAVVADAACTLATVARARGEDWRMPLLGAGAVLREAEEGGSLNLLKARWGEISSLPVGQLSE